LISKRKTNSNRKNAKNSTGPRSERGRRHSKGNALRHGLAVAIGSDPSFSEDIEALARLIAGDSILRSIQQFARQAAEAEIDLLRIRKLRAANFQGVYGNPQVAAEDYAKLDEKLLKLDRYEVRAVSRRKRAISVVVRELRYNDTLKE
jgi:hypothetical protein